MEVEIYERHMEVSTIFWNAPRIVLLHWVVNRLTVTHSLNNLCIYTGLCRVLPYLSSCYVVGTGSHCCSQGSEGIVLSFENMAVSNASSPRWKKCLVDLNVAETPPSVQCVLVRYYLIVGKKKHSDGVQVEMQNKR